MSELKDGWKEAGKNLGGAFKTFGKTFVKSARTVVDKADDKVNDPKKEETKEAIDVKEVSVNEQNTPPVTSETEVIDAKPKESTVFNDGSWREVGKGFGKGFGGMGKMIGKTLSKPFKKNKNVDKE